jgi:hypothetical protein
MSVYLRWFSFVAPVGVVSLMSLGCEPAIKLALKLTNRISKKYKFLNWINTATIWVLLAFWWGSSIRILIFFRDAGYLDVLGL